MIRGKSGRIILGKPITLAVVCMMGIFMFSVVLPARLAAQAGPSPDPAPIFLLKTILDEGNVAHVERLIRDNLEVTKSRLEDFIVARDGRFDELGRFGATSGHEVHKAVLDEFMEENLQYARLYELYRDITGDEELYIRFEARRLRYEGAFFTHSGEDECGDHLDWDHANEFYEKALSRLDQAFALATQIDDLRLMTSTKINMGSTLIRMIEPERAIVEYEEALGYASQLPGNLYPAMVGLNMGNTYVWMGQPEKSLSYAQDALVSARKLGRGTWESNVQMVIGNAQLQQKQFASAWETLRTALDLAIQSGEDRVRGKALINLGMVAAQLKRPEAMTYLEDAREWYTEHGDVYTLIESEVIMQDTLMMMSRVAGAAGQAEEAENYRRRYYQSISEDPERYNEVRNSPCYALYKARPVVQKQSQTVQ